MPRISKISTKTFGDIVKQKKIAQKRLEKEKAAAIQAANELKFDKFVRNTAKDILKKSFWHELKVIDVVNTKNVNKFYSGIDFMTDL